VGLLLNPTTPEVMVHAPELVEHLAVIPSRLWYDFGVRHRAGRRFHPAREMFAAAAALRQGRSLTGHSLGLSLPSAMPLDQGMVNAIAEMAEDLGGFDWFSEHLNLFVAPRGSEPNSEAGMALPVSYDRASFDLIATKLRQLRTALDCPLLLENPSVFTPLPEMEMDEPEFLNLLRAEGLCGILLDLHNLLVSARNGGEDPGTYLARLDPTAVEEVHLAGGEDLNGFYTDSHSHLTPEEVWEQAYEYLPRCPNLRAITFEYQESYYENIGLDGVIAELERMHHLAECCVSQGADPHAA
jgi:uncharacterized protein